MSKLTKTKVPFGMVPNELLNNENISFSAKGLYAFLESKPKDWEWTRDNIELGTSDSLPDIVLALKELEDNGYYLDDLRNLKKNNYE
jgi:hypothetical protein